MANIAEEINFLIDDVVDNYSLAMLEAGQVAWNKVKGQIAALKVDPQTQVVQGGQHVDIGTPITATIQSSRVQRAKERTKNQLAPIRRVIRNRYEEKFETEAPYETVRIATGLSESTKNLLDNELSESNFIMGVVLPAEGAMTNHLASGSTISFMLQDMEHRIRNRLEAFSQVKTFTIMQTYARDINLTFGGAFSKRVKYVGPVDDRNRDFCHDRMEQQGRRRTKSFSLQEVAEWPQRYAPWDGMLPGTTNTNIFVNAGGFNCRHQFEFLTIEGD